MNLTNEKAVTAVEILNKLTEKDGKPTLIIEVKEDYIGEKGRACVRVFNATKQKDSEELEKCTIMYNDLVSLVNSVAQRFSSWSSVQATMVANENDAYPKLYPFIQFS